MLLSKKQPLLNEDLITVLENAISNAKSVKIIDFDTPNKTEEIISKTNVLKQTEYTDVITELRDAYNSLKIDIQKYELVNAPSEAYVIKCLKTLSEIKNISAVTEDNDPMKNLNKPGWYIAMVYFSDERINLDKSIYGNSVIEQGTIGGGSIEVYKTQEEAIKRNEYLACFDGGTLSSGSHRVLGTCVIRTSDELTATQQKDLENKICEALTYIESTSNDLTENATIPATTLKSPVTEMQSTPNTNKPQSTTEPKKDTEPNKPAQIENTTKTTNTTSANLWKKEIEKLCDEFIYDCETDSSSQSEIRKLFNGYGYTTEQINYGVSYITSNDCGESWNGRAVNRAIIICESENSFLSRTSLQTRLINCGFTESEAKYGAQNGYDWEYFGLDVKDEIEFRDDYESLSDEDIISIFVEKGFTESEAKAIMGL